MAKTIDYLSLPIEDRIRLTREQYIDALGGEEAYEEYKKKIIGEIPPPEEMLRILNETK